MFNFAFDLPAEGGLPPAPPKGLSNDANSLVIFPPDGFIEVDRGLQHGYGGGNSVVSMVDVHLKEVMCHASVRIITSLEKQMEICEDCRLRGSLPTSLPLSTIYDDIGDRDPLSGVLGNAKDPAGPRRAFKRKPSGRIHKWMGDLSLQVSAMVTTLRVRSFLAVAR